MRERLERDAFSDYFGLHMMFWIIIYGTTLFHVHYREREREVVWERERERARGQD